MTELEQDALTAASIAARIVADKYQYYVEAEDLAQEGIEWLLKHPHRVEHARMEDTGRLQVHQLVAEIADPLGRRAKRVKMAKLGVDPRDLVKYNRRTVEAALPVVWDSTYRPTAPEGEQRGRVDPALRGNWEATAMDVKQAVREVCTKNDERLLFVTYGLEAKTREAAWRTGHPRDDIAPRVHKIVTQLVDHLNDDVTLPDDVPHEGPGSRAVLTNAHAQVLTSVNYGGS